MSVSFRVLLAAAAMTLAGAAVATPIAPPQAASKPTLSSTPATPKPVTAQQQRMKDCNKDAKAKGLKGADRKSFMSTCLKGDKAAAKATK